MPLLALRKAGGLPRAARDSAGTAPSLSFAAGWSNRPRGGDAPFHAKRLAGVPGAKAFPIARRESGCGGGKNRIRSAAQLLETCRAPLCGRFFHRAEVTPQAPGPPLLELPVRQGDADEWRSLPTASLSRGLESPTNPQSRD